jgi:voltage-gated potassium channel Kch
MVLSFTVIGSLLAGNIHWDRVLAIVLIYFSALGIGAHALDALGSKGIKPWGTVFSRVQLWTLAAVSLALAYGIGIYYIVLYVPLLTVMALLEGFFVFAYNLEWFGGRFHTDRWFAFSWGLLPVLSGYIIQTNSLSLAALVLAASMALISLVEITASRPYKELKRRLPALGEEEKALMARYERILQYTSSSVILLGAGLLIGRLTG